MAFYCGFHLHFPNHWWYWISFHVLFSHLYILPGKNVYSSLLFFIQILLLLLSLGVFYIFWILSLYQTCNLQIFSSILWVAFLVFFDEEKVLILMKSIFLTVLLLLFKRSPPNPMHEAFPFSSKSLIVLALTFRSKIHS